MKKKLMGLRLVLSLGIVGAAIGAGFLSSKPVMVAAEDAKSAGVYLKGSFNAWGETDLMYYKTGSSFVYYITKSLASGDTFKIFDGEHGDIWVNNLDSSISSALFSLNEKGDVDCNTTGLYKLTYTYTNENTRWISSIEAISYAVSEYAVVDGIVEATAFATENAESISSFDPTVVNRSGYLFDDWYTDAACTNRYVAKTWTEAGNLYAKYTAYTTEKYVYFSAPSNWANCYAYTFGGKSGLGAFPGTKITLATDGVNYQGSGIYKAAFYADSNDTAILFNKGAGGTVGTDQTADLVLSENTFYKLSDSSTGDSDRGFAAAVVYDINAARRGVNASGSVLVASVCGISKATATTLLAEYDALNDVAKGYVNAATDFVYNSENPTNGVDVTFDHIIAELRQIANKTGGAPAAITGIGDSAWTPAWIALISLGIASVASAGLLIGRRKHE